MPEKRDQARRTPKWLFEYLDEQFGPFELDAAAATASPALSPISVILTILARVETEPDSALNTEVHPSALQPRTRTL